MQGDLIGNKISRGKDSTVLQIKRTNLQGKTLTIYSKATSFLFLIKIIAKLERTLSTA